jgi:lysophospholipase L1-like esterase
VDASSRILSGGGFQYDFTNRVTAVGPGLPSLISPVFFGNVLAHENGNRVGKPLYITPTVVQTRALNTNIKPVLVIGDSILRAGGDPGSQYNRAGFENPGWVGRGFKQLGIPVVTLGVAGDRAELSPPESMSKRAAFIRELGVDTGVIQYGVNDAVSQSAYSTFKAPAEEMLDRNRVIANFFRSIGLKRVVVATLLPNTTSSDGFTTVASQKLKNNDYKVPNWVTYNELVRSNPVGFDGWIDPASKVADASSRWRPSPPPTANVALGGSTLKVVMPPRGGDSIQGYYHGSFLKFTSGLLTGQSSFVTNSYAKPDGIHLEITNPLSGAPVRGSSFNLWWVLTKDGVHPTPAANQMAAAAIVEKPELWVYF